MEGEKVRQLNLLDFIQRFDHIAEQIFMQFDKKSLVYCREVSKSWQEYIDDKNLPWIQIVNVPKIPKEGYTYLSSLSV